MKYIGKYLSGEILLTRECLILMPVRKSINGENKKICCIWRYIYLFVQVHGVLWNLPHAERQDFDEL